MSAPTPGGRPKGRCPRTGLTVPDDEWRIEMRRLGRPGGVVARTRIAMTTLMARKRARERLAAAWRELHAAREAFVAHPDDDTYRRWRAAEVGVDDAQALAQEWGVGERFEPGARW